MDWKSNLRRTQSLRSIPSSCDKPTWTEAGLRDKTTSVSQLVARYQTTVELSTSVQETLVINGGAKPKQVFKKVAPSLLEGKETHLESPMRRNDAREQSGDKTSLTRSKSMGSLQSSARSIGALKALFESKVVTQDKAKSSLRAVSFTSPKKAADVEPVVNGEVEEVKSSAEEPEIHVPATNRSIRGAKADAKDPVTRKVVNQTQAERRKTIGGIDFETIAAYQADEKRRSVADFRGSSFLQAKEKLCGSVKAMSALYLSKVVPQETTPGHLKPAQGQSSESGKRIKLTKMAEDSQQRKDDLSTPASAGHQPGPEDVSGANPPQSTLCQLSKEKLYLQRQKCELRRLLKHTHPELKMLDEAVDEELAEVLSSETGATAGETGYEGEVLSRRLIFENCALSNRESPYNPPMHKAAGTVERGDVRKSSAVFEEHKERPCNESDKGIVEDEKTLGSGQDPNRECEEEMTRIDVQATRRIFESQSVNTSTPNPENKLQRKVSITGDETGAVQKRKQEFEMCSRDHLHSENKGSICSKSFDLTDQSNKQGQCVHIINQSTGNEFTRKEEVSTGKTVVVGEPTSLLVPEESGEIIKTNAALVQNNPFIQTNIEREQSFVHPSKSQSPVEDSGEAQDYVIANVKNRAHMFESMPFYKIGHQSKDEIETMVENIKETLKSLYHGNALHSEGSIIEVNETMIAKKAKFTLSESGPEINYDEVAEGGAQNFIVQLLPRVNLKPQVTYLKEDGKGSMEATVVDVPVHQHHFTTNQDTEFKTANVVQLVEDILIQDNSLRKGVIIQEDTNGCAEVIVYSLHKYIDEEDVKTYCPPKVSAYDEPEPERGDVSNTEHQELRKGIIESTISCLLETPIDQTCQGSIRPEITVKGNVKLFKSCIEKGDLEYLRTFQAEPTMQEQELPSNQNVTGQGMELLHEQRCDQAEESSEWVPVDVKRLKNLFSGDQRPVQPKQSACTNHAQSTTVSCAFTGQVKNSFRECGGKTQEEVSTSTAASQGSYLHCDMQNDGRVLQVELVKVVDDNDEISNLQTAIHILQQATTEAKSLQHSSQKEHRSLVQEPVVSVTAGNDKQTEEKLSCKNKEQRDELPSTSNITSEDKQDLQHDNTETCNSEEVQATVACSKMGQNNAAMVQEQHFQAAIVSIHSPEKDNAPQEDEEVVFEGKLQAALDSLERSNINVSRGDFKAAMIYRNASKPHKERSQTVDAASPQMPTKEAFRPVAEPKSTQATLRQEVSKEQGTPANVEPPSQRETLNKPAASAVSEKIRSPVGPKPAIPPKPEYLKVKQRDIQSTDIKNLEATQINTVTPKETVHQPLPMTPMSCKDEQKQDLFKMNTGAASGTDSVAHQRNKLFDEATQMSQVSEVRHQVQGAAVILQSDNNETIFKLQQESTAEKKSPEDFPVKENMNETDESHVDFHEARKKFGGKNAFSAKNAPAKPKRVKMAKPDNKNTKRVSGDNSSSLAHVVEVPHQTLTGPSCDNPNACGQTADGKDELKKGTKQENKVEMREKKGRTETEGERRQRLSVHMDEIMRGNITAAMDIFENLRKQEELQGILSRVEEIEEDTSEVDVRTLRGVFENVPDWVVSSDRKKQKKAKVENKEGSLPLTRDNSESKSSMAHVFGDLERASAEIMNLKEQTLARLVDIEEAIKKALYSVSTLKSDSDIAGLSCLFKESLGTEQGSPSFGSISTISIGSSRTKSLQTQESPPAQRTTAPPVSQSASIEVAPAKHRASPPSSPSPAFISIQSAARKTNKTEVPPSTICPTCQHSTKAEGNFRTTKTLTCNSPAENRKRGKGKKQSCHKPKREVSVLEVQTDGDGNSVTGTKTVTENYERTDHLGNRFYSSKTSTVVSGEPEATTSIGPAAVGTQVTEYPEVQLPINQKS